MPICYHFNEWTKSVVIHLYIKHIVDSEKKIYDRADVQMSEEKNS